MRCLQPRPAAGAASRRAPVSVAATNSGNRPCMRHGLLPAASAAAPGQSRLSSRRSAVQPSTRHTNLHAPRPAAVLAPRQRGDSTATAALPASAPLYSADSAADEWSRRPVPVVARLFEIAAAFGSWWVKSTLRKDPQQAAAHMRKVLVDLGPAFVKIGQALSSRPDVLPPEYIAELELLQDRIPPFSNDEALQVIEAELGLPWTQVFSSLSPCPVAAASLGQVYRGRLASNGAEVAVKVQRPGVVEAIGRDTYILRNLAGIAREQAKLNTDLPALVDEWASSLFKELDYRREAANGIRFAQLFSFMPEVVVPQMYTDWTTPRVLVMEWIEGERLRSASDSAVAAAAAAGASGSSSSSSSGGGSGAVGAQVAARQHMIQQQRHSPEQVADDLRLVEIGVRCSLEQILEEGFYHADPHQGNLLKTRDGRLAYLDFGMVSTIEPPVRQALIRATLHLVNREYESLADDFVALGLLPRGSAMDEVVPALTGVFQKALAGGVSNLSFSSLTTDLGRTMYKYSFRLPPYYTLLVRSLSVLEGIALASDPNYKVLGAAYPWVSRRLLLTTNSPELTATLDNLLYDSQGRFNFDRLESLLEQAAKARVEASTAPRTPAAAAAGGVGGGGSVTAGLTSSSSSSGGLGSSGAAAVQQQQRQQGLLAGVAAAVGQALAGREGSELLLSSLQLLSSGGGDSNGGSGGGWQQQVSGRGSAAAAAGGPLALVLSPEGRHIRGILEDELAKGLDAAVRLNLDRTFDTASEQLQGVVAFAAGTPLGSSLVPQWLLDQVNSRHAAVATSSSSSPSSSSSSSSAAVDAVVSSSSTDSSNRPDLIESLLNLPRLADEGDRAQVDGLQRLAVQLAAFSSPLPATTTTSSSSSSSTSSSGSGDGSRGAAGVMQQQQQQQTAQQEANAAALQQVRQAALVLRWFASEVQLLSPEARREALAIPMRILSKTGSRVAARAVRAVLTPSSAAGAGGRGGRGGGVRVVNPGAASSLNPVVLDPGASAARASSSSSSGVVMTPVGGAGPSQQQQQQVRSEVVPAGGSSNGSGVSSNGRSSTPLSNGSSNSVQVPLNSGSNGAGSSSSSSGNGSSSGGAGVGGGELPRDAVVRATTPLPGDGKGGLKGGRMLVLTQPAGVGDS